MPIVEERALKDGSLNGSCPTWCYIVLLFPSLEARACPSEVPRQRSWTLLDWAQLLPATHCSLCSGTLCAIGRICVGSLGLARAEPPAAPNWVSVILAPPPPPPPFHHHNHTHTSGSRAVSHRPRHQRTCRQGCVRGGSAFSCASAASRSNSCNGGHLSPGPLPRHRRASVANRAALELLIYPFTLLGL